MDGKEGTISLVITLIILLIVFLRSMFPWMFSELIEVKADDGLAYLVMNMRDKKAAANKLATIRSNLLNLINDFQQELPETELQRIRHKFKAILSENVPGGRHTSYTVNKGDHMYMCIRERDEDNRLIDDNTLMFVALHELAHVMTKSIGHETDFKENFRLLLKHAQKRGYYKYVPYHLKPKKYCGTQITALP